jgi:hypothetical protein
MPKKSKKTTRSRVKIESIKPEAAPKKLSAIDAAAKVLADADQPLNAKEIIDRMTTAGLWTSPSGKTPWATISAAIQRSITKHGDASPFRKAERGKFTVAS